MVKFLYTELDVFGIIIIFIILCNQISGAAITIQQRIFNYLLVVIIGTLIFDAGMWIVDGMVFDSARKFNLFFSTGYYIMNGIVPYLWLLYVEFLVNNDVKRLKKTAVTSMIPLVVYSIMILLNIKNETVFIINSNNFYHRGPCIYIPIVLTGYYFALTMFKIYKKIKTVSDTDEKKQMYYLASFIIFPIIATIIQLFFAGTSIIWVSVVISLLIIFVNVQNKQILTDSLTGLNNRIQFEKYINALIKDAQKQEQICLIVIDIDKFKLINDTFGHAEGDRALIFISNILKKACKNKKVFISRYGGDEFLIVYKVKEIEQLDELINDIYFDLDVFNKTKGLPYKMHLSIGRAIWNPNECNSVKDLFINADKCMYDEKKKKCILM